jgi:hypothetical protein
MLSSSWKYRAKAKAAARAAGHDVTEDHLGGYDLLPDIYELASALNIETVEALEASIEPPDFKVFQRLANVRPNIPWAATPDFLFFLLMLRKHPDKMNVTEMVSRGWAEESAKRVLESVK